MTSEAPPESRPGASLRSFAGVVAAFGLALVALQLLFDVAGPIRSDDVWWHIALGDSYRAEGPWLDSDPLLYTAVDGPPPPHSWLFDASLSLIDEVGASTGLRLAHFAIALFLVLFAYRVFRKESGERAFALLATSILLLLMLDRLVRLRPDLVSIPAAMGLYALLLSGEGPPSWRRVALSAGLVGLWANLHAAFGVGPLLLVAALSGIGIRLLLWRFVLVEASDGDREQRFASERLWATRIAAALGLGLLLALLNPRGIDQHLSYLISSGAQTIGAIGDDWVRFDPSPSGRTLQKLGFSAWLAADATLVLFAACAVFAAARLLARRNAEALRAGDPMLFALGAAACVAIFVSQRFLWMSVFPLLCVLRTLMSLQPGHFASLALASVALLIGLFETRNFVLPTRQQLGAMLATPFAAKYPSDEVHFLAETQMSGHLLGRYSTSGFYGYWLAPKLRTTVNGSLNFPSTVFQDYFAVVNGGGVRRGESYREALARQEVDLFLGVGIPEETVGGAKRFYTTLRLEAEPGWLLVSRGLDHAIHLRRSARNAENLERVAAYYEREGVPFDRARGLDVGLVLSARPDWAIRTRMIPSYYPTLLDAVDHDDPRVAFEALGLLATLHLLLGDYEAQIAFEQRALELGPMQLAPRRRLVFGLLRLGRTEEALATALAMQGIAPGTVSAEFLRAVELQLELKSDGSGARADAAERFMFKLPVVPRDRYYGMIGASLEPAPRLSRSGDS